MFETLGRKPRWAPRVRQHKLHRLYENDARGIVDDELIDQVAGDAGRPDTRRIAVMTLAHFVNDSYGQYLAILLPLMAASLHFSLGLASIVVTAYTITSSIIQPLLGHFADRHTTRYISVLGLV